jgi:hypothetical protein
MTVKNKIMINATDLKPFYLYSSCLHYKFKLYKIVEAATDKINLLPNDLCQAMREKDYAVLFDTRKQL